MYINKVRSRTATSCKLSNLPEIFEDLCFSNDLEKRPWFSDSAGQNILECTKKLTRHFCKKILVFLWQASVLSKKTFFSRILFLRGISICGKRISLCRKRIRLLAATRQILLLQEENPLAAKRFVSLAARRKILLPQKDFLLATRGISPCRKRILSRGIPLAAKF